MTGPKVRTDYVDVYVFKRSPGVQFLQLLRASTPLEGTWQPVMGCIEPGETAVQAMWRELREETGLAQGDAACLAAWALEEVHPFYIARTDTIHLSPRFAVEAAPSWSPTLNWEHSDHRWVEGAEVERSFMWPGQCAAIRELVGRVLAPGSLCGPVLRLHGPGA